MLKKPLFCQYIFSSLIICMTMVIMAEQESLVNIIPFMAYLMGMILQVFMYCYSANEITVAVSYLIFGNSRGQFLDPFFSFQSNKLTRKIYSTNFVDFDSKTKRILLFFMMRFFWLLFDLISKDELFFSEVTKKSISRLELCFKFPSTWRLSQRWAFQIFKISVRHS